MAQSPGYIDVSPKHIIWTQPVYFNKFKSAHNLRLLLASQNPFLDRF